MPEGSHGWIVVQPDNGLNRLTNRRPLMRFYEHPHPYYCGVDLRARTMHVYVADDDALTPSDI
ncbi:MAG: hypothetical protein JWN70_6050 [Planctomycetaceae bacterium]|nr:hypothetical protein [Planctomycetaceae bacterium]